MNTAKTMKTKAKTQRKTAPVKTIENAFSGAADSLGAGIDALFTQGSDDAEFMVNLDDIEVVEQVREQMEDDEQDLAGLGASLAKYQIQAILLRTMPAGHPKPYRLVAGERRYRAAVLHGLTQLRAKAREMTDEQAEDFQFAENIHRKNLTQIEEAKKIQRDLNQLGSVDAVLEKYQKSRAWLSKVLSLLNLPKQAKRLVVENVSADVEVINAVKTIEKTDPQAAKALVEDLKATRGKSNAREKANAVKDKVKPGKKAKTPPGDGVVATKKNRNHKEPGPGSIFADAKNDDGPYIDPTAELLRTVYSRIMINQENFKKVLGSLERESKDAVETWLQPFYDAGTNVNDAGHDVIQGLRKGQFSTVNAGAFALAAFLQGVKAEAKFDLVKVDLAKVFENVSIRP